MNEVDEPVYGCQKVAVGLRNGAECDGVHLWAGHQWSRAWWESRLEESSLFQGKRFEGGLMLFESQLWQRLIQTSVSRDRDALRTLNHRQKATHDCSPLLAIVLSGLSLAPLFGFSRSPKPRVTGCGKWLSKNIMSRCPHGTTPNRTSEALAL